MLLIIIVVVCLSIGYSAYNRELMISGEGIVRADVPIRITDVKLMETTNEGRELYNSTYSVDTTNMFVTLPNQDSSVTYEISVVNDTGSSIYVNDILEEINTNENIIYTIEGIKEGQVIDEEEITFQIIFQNNSLTKQDINLSIQYDFVILEETEWLFAYTGSEEVLSVPYNGTYKLEVWGAQGGNTTRSVGGYGGYSTGTITLNKNDTLYINVGGQGETSLTSAPDIRTIGGYNGGGYGYIYSGVTLLAAGGGGATHISTRTGLLSELENNKEDILIVAGGGAGAYGYGDRWWNGNPGGGFIGAYSNEKATAGTQNSGYAFGMGGNTLTSYTTNVNYSGGGGGYYGGLPRWGEIGAGGGSGYIGNPLLKDKVMYGYVNEESQEESTKTVTTTNISEEPISSFAKIGNGYAKITLMTT